jgi:uncharacterized protein YndB with AHSA1/START domain
MIDYSISIDAPVDLVYDMLTDAALLTEWMAVSADVDHRPDGAFRWVYENGDVVAGRFLQLEPPRRLVLAYGWERPVERGIPPGSTVVEIVLEDDRGSTLLRLVHRGLPPGELESHRHGWEFFLGRLKSNLARTASIQKGGSHG